MTGGARQIHATRLLYQAEHGSLPPAGEARCWLCGEPCPEDGPRAADVVRSTFNDMARGGRSGILVYPASDEHARRYQLLDRWRVRVLRRVRALLNTESTR